MSDVALSSANDSCLRHQLTARQIRQPRALSLVHLLNRAPHVTGHPAGIGQFGTRREGLMCSRRHFFAHTLRIVVSSWKGMVAEFCWDPNEMILLLCIENGIPVVA